VAVVFISLSRVEMNLRCGQKLAHNMAFERDAPKAARPSTLR